MFGIELVINNFATEGTCNKHIRYKLFLKNRIMQLNLYATDNFSIDKESNKIITANWLHFLDKTLRKSKKLEKKYNHIICLGSKYHKINVLTLKYEYL